MQSFTENILRKNLQLSVIYTYLGKLVRVDSSRLFCVMKHGFLPGRGVVEEQQEAGLSGSQISV